MGWHTAHTPQEPPAGAVGQCARARERHLDLRARAVNIPPASRRPLHTLLQDS